jgi:hypothetical protein
MANFEMWLVGQGRKCWLRVTCNLDLGCILVVRWDNGRVRTSHATTRVPMLRYEELQVQRKIATTMIVDC